METQPPSLAAERARLETIIDGMCAGTWDWNVQTGEVIVSERWAAITGHTLAELSPITIRTWEALGHPDDIARSNALLRRHFSGELSHYDCEVRMRHRDGTWVWVRDTGKVGTWTPDGRPEWMFGTCLDVTDQKRAYERLERMERLMAEGQAISHLGTFEYIAESKTTVWSEEEYRIYGLDPTGPSPAYDVMLATCIHPEDAACLHETFSSALRTSSIYELEHRIVRPDGTVRWVADRAHPRFGSDGRLIRYVGTTLDITERKLAEQERAESEARYQALFENMTAGCVLFEVVQDDAGTPVDLIIVAANKGFESTTGLSPAFVVGQRLSKALPGIEKDEADWIGTYGRVAITGEAREFEQVSDLLGYAYAVSAYRAGPRQCAVTFTNITERKRSEAEEANLRSQLAQAQRMESVGRLAGGVAHDFNNMLGVILGHAELASDKLDAAHAAFGDLQEIRQAARRSANLTRQLLAFARRQNIAPKVLDLNETIEGMLRMMRRLIGEDVDVLWKPARQQHLVKMDPSQVDQVLANLCVNARDAIEGVGTVVIETGSATFDAAYCAEHLGFTPGDYALLSVSDNGCGMDQETRSHLFEPFFTTKELGKGTGLGLATVYGIVKQNGGFINVYSEPGEGTTFRIYLPLHVDANGALQREGDSGSVIARGHETILLVEDEPAHLRLTALTLEALGYTVMPAGLPTEAIELARTHSGAIHLLITDVVMPGMNGRHLAEAVSNHCPGIKCLFMSGYTANVIAHRGVLDEDVHFLQKPFSRRDLAAKVREALDLPAGLPGAWPRHSR